jgi:hypothetical protein
MAADQGDPHRGGGYALDKTYQLHLDVNLDDGRQDQGSRRQQPGDAPEAGPNLGPLSTRLDSTRLAAADHPFSDPSAGRRSPLERALLIGISQPHGRLARMHHSWCLLWVMRLAVSPHPGASC